MSSRKARRRRPPSHAAAAAPPQPAHAPPLLKPGGACSWERCSAGPRWKMRTATQRWVGGAAAGHKPGGGRRGGGWLGPVLLVTWCPAGASLAPCWHFMHARCGAMITPHLGGSRGHSAPPAGTRPNIPTLDMKLRARRARALGAAPHPGSSPPRPGSSPPRPGLPAAARAHLCTSAPSPPLPSPPTKKNKIEHT